jgi:hypothetical protein
MYHESPYVQPFFLIWSIATMDIIVFAIGLYLFTQKHRILGSVMMIFGGLYIALGLLQGYIILSSYN